MTAAHFVLRSLIFVGFCVSGLAVSTGVCGQFDEWRGHGDPDDRRNRRRFYRRMTLVAVPAFAASCALLGWDWVWS